MKKLINKIAVFSLLAMALGLGACTTEPEGIVDSIELNRCLSPMNFEAKIQNGEYIVFSWDATKGADQYCLQVSTNENFEGALFFDETLTAEQNPYTVHAEADVTYYARVKAQTSDDSKEESKWTILEGSVKTYAVKSHLAPYIKERTAESITLAWTPDVEVTHLLHYVVGTPAEEAVRTEVEAAGVEAGAWTISGLKPSTQYNVSVNFKSANRGEVLVYTRPSVEGATEVATAAELQKALADGAAKIVLTNATEPYDFITMGVASLEIQSSVELYGMEAADGTKPKVLGEMNFKEGFDGSFYAEGIDFDGNSHAKGFALQGKNGSSVAINLTSVKFNNCTIQGYSKGLFYEWGKPITIGELAWENCYINNIAGNGGDCVDFRTSGTTIGTLSVKNNTLVDGMRTFLRIDAAIVIENLLVENNTFQNIANFDNTNNQGILGVKATVSGEYTLKNNLFLNETSAQSKLVGTTATAPKTIAGNWFYNCTAENWFNAACDEATATATGGVLSADPCFNSLGGLFYLTNEKLLAAQVGASAWWLDYVEPALNTEITVLEGGKLWDFGDSKTFNSTVNKTQAIDNLLFVANGSTIGFSEGVLGFGNAASLDQKNLPVDCAVQFKVSTPGSVYVLPIETEANNGAHIVVAVNGVVKGGAAPAAAAETPVKVLLADIAEESVVSVYGSGVVGMRSLQWALDTDPIENSLKAPEPVLEIENVVEGNGTDVVVSWEAVNNAGSYSVTFSGKTYTVEETTYTIAAQTVGFLSAGNYPVLVVANPAEDDIYYSASGAGKAVLTISKPAQEEGGENAGTVVKTADELLAALGAGKDAITLAEGLYDLTAVESIGESGVVTLIAPVKLAGESGAVIKGGFKLSGEIAGEVTFEGLEFNGDGTVGIPVEIVGPVSAEKLTIKDCYIHDYAKGLFYCSKQDSLTADQIHIEYVNVLNNKIENIKGGQDGFDIRWGTFCNIRFIGNSVANSFREAFRIDLASGSVICQSLQIRRNTFYNVTNASGKAILYVRAAIEDWKVTDNLFLFPADYAGKFSRSTTEGYGAEFKNNFFYVEETAEAPNANIWSGDVTAEQATANGGVLLTASPVKDAAAGDFTLTNAVAMACKVGAPMWNPAFDKVEGESFTVNNVDEFNAALGAGKTNITLAAAGSPYVIGSINVAKDFVLSGEVGAAKPVVVGQFNLAGDLGSVLFSNIRFEENAESAHGVLFNVSQTEPLTANSIQVRNCEIYGYTKSVFYEPGKQINNVTALVFSNIRVSDMGNGQGIFDIRDGSDIPTNYGTILIEQSTFENGGRDFIRLDNKAGATTSLRVVNNTFNNVMSKANKGFFYVRRALEDYVVANNLFMNLHYDQLAPSGCIVPEMANNYFYNVVQYDETDPTVETHTIWCDNLTAEMATANGGVVLTVDPVKDAANGDYTLTYALAMSNGVGARCWNPMGATRPSESFTASNTEEFITALNAGKTVITLANNGTIYDLRTIEEVGTNGIVTLTADLTLKGEKRDGGYPTLIGGFKVGKGVSTLAVSNLVLNGDNAVGNFLEAPAPAEGDTEAIAVSSISIRNCEATAYAKSFFYGNSTNVTCDVLTIKNVFAHNLGTGQGTLDIRAGSYGTVVVENCSWVNGGRDWFRFDNKGSVTNSVLVKNNTFANNADNGNGVLYIRLEGIGNYTVENNLFLNMTGEKNTIAKGGSVVPEVSNNWFYNCSAASWWTTNHSEEVMTANGGGVLTTITDAEGNVVSVVADAENNDFTITNEELKAKQVGDPRWY